MADFSISLPHCEQSGGTSMCSELCEHLLLFFLLPVSDTKSSPLNSCLHTLSQPQHPELLLCSSKTTATAFVVCDITFCQQAVEPRPSHRPWGPGTVGVSCVMVSRLSTGCFPHLGLVIHGRRRLQPCESFFPFFPRPVCSLYSDKVLTSL